ncbi:MAG TPA: TIGR04326 family surface carbohydrate biosynthesis protein [Gemmatimonadaceae bacterium]|nr:TIGR04326 family surface carbohydrate biosynthesis protein [Gemmatimonadaceae bacterium]
MLLLDDLPGPADSEPVLKWRGYAEEANAISVSRHLDRRGDALRTKYLSFVHDLGETIIAGRPLRQHFEAPDGFSLWWMNRVPEKSPFKSSRIFDCLRLLALEEILVERGIRLLTLYSTDDVLAKAVSLLCDGLGVQFSRAAAPKERRPLTLRRFYGSLPHFARGLLSFRHLALRWSFRRILPVHWHSRDGSVFACSYFFNLDPAATGVGRFHSRQWESLPGWLRERGVRMNWLHHYLPYTMPVEASASLLQAFNRDETDQGRHAFLESYLSGALLWRMLRQWLRTLAAGLRLPDLTEPFRPRGSAASLWPLLADDWHNSLSGTASVSNSVWYVLFDAALGDVPRQQRGVYLYEGQGWEAAFLHAWRKHGHGEVVAVPHSSTPFWYLNLYDDRRCVAPQSPCRKPQPDRWALNGPMAWNAFVDAGYSPDRLVPVEALRYQHLLTSAPTPRATFQPTPAAPLRLLVLGDFTREQTLRMLARVEQAAATMEKGLEITVKLHPACHVDAGDVGGLRCEFTTKPLGEILSRFDAAFSSNTTSASLDALLSGLPVVVFLDDDVMNNSPLRGVDGVAFVTTGTELAGELAAARDNRLDASPADFFWLDADLHRWEALLVP